MEISTINSLQICKVGMKINSGLNEASERTDQSTIQRLTGP